MASRPLDFRLPLLTKELVEQAARWQTYAFRVGYALLLFGGAYWMFQGILAEQSVNALGVLGKGKEMFRSLVGLQMLGIYLFMPAMTCGAITQEKERNSLGILLLTRLNPFTIVMEKLLSRLVPMLSFQLLSLPLLAYAYALGGITQLEFWCSLWMLALASLQVGSFAIACSTFARTTVGAFILTYVLGATLLVAPLLCCQSPNMGMAATDQEMLIRAMVYTMPSVFVTVTSVTVASSFLVPRAFVEPRNFMLEVFKSLDRTFHEMNQNPLTRGIVLINDSVSLPVVDPISWRETKKKSLGTVRYLFRILSAIEMPLLFVLVAVADATSRSRLQAASVILMILWAIAIVLVSVQATSLISGERSRQTLDVLLTMPLSGRDILLQKFHGVRRMALVLFIPFLTTFGFETWWQEQVASMYSISMNGWGYLGLSCLSTFIYLWLTAWFSVAIGLKFHVQSRAIILALALVFGWGLIPVFLRMDFLFDGTPLNPAMIFPGLLISALEQKSLPIAAAVVNLTLHGAALILVRRYCLSHVDRMLNRCELENLPIPAS